MFYSLIKQKRDIWYNSQECTVKELIKYMEVTNELRDVQIDAIKTYLFLKIACNNKPLWELFYEGAFNTLDVSTLELAQNTRDYLLNNPYALALYQYATTKNDKNEQVSIKLEREIKSNFDKIDYKEVFRKLFY
ncbi:MAG TPA: type III restriction endonuclease subunit R, partial [Candidatus Limenecus avicola]|nr:type III restriction endonuclease subunit R [Candidatus Limenecus avicola]